MNKLKIINEKTAKIGDLYGIFFEDLNHAADGGLYAEMVRNRSFEFSAVDNPMYSGLTAWNEIEPEGTSVSMAIESREPFNKKNPHYLTVDIKTDGTYAGVRNEGYNSGMPIYEGAEYRLKLCAKGCGSDIRVTLISADGIEHDSAVFKLKDQWTDFEAVFIGKRDDFSAKLAITMNKTGKVMLDFVSLFPLDTYRGRENGMRRDIAEMLEALTPRFMRFPGGCLVHDGSLDKDERDSNYRWKNTIGDIRTRPARRNNWRYNQSLGIGYYEYFQFCEDIKAEPLPVLPAAYNPHSKQGLPLDELDEYIDDALDLIEFANGDITTKWGSIRAELGHKEPFDLKYIAIGNEEVGQGFFDRYDYFHKAIKEKYPDIKIINSAGPFNHGSEYDKGWASARKNKSDFVDEHYYMTPEWFIANHHRYDDFKSEDPKVFLGEYASWGNTYYNAVAEASYMIGLENNAHAVGLACYAPLLCNVQYVNWEPDMIWFDNHRVFGTANYYVQKMFMNNLPSYLLRVEKEGLDRKLVIGSEKIAGGISIIGDRAEISLTDIKITDNETGETEHIGSMRLGGSDKRYITNIRSGSYTIEMNAVKNYGELGFKIAFGQTDEEHRYVWSVGGWQNQDCLIDKFEGHASCLTQSRYSMPVEVVQKLKLVVNGRNIKTYINDVLMNDITDIRQVNEELYITAGIDMSSDEIIIKAVNINDTPAKSVIELPFEGGTDIKVTELSGYQRDDKNTFDNPEYIKPKEINMFSDKNSFEYEFKPLSVTVFRISKR